MAEPKVRFKRDDGSSYPAWTLTRLSDLFQRVNERNNGQFDNTKWISVAKMYYQAPEKVQSNNIDTRTYVMRYGDIAFEGHPNEDFMYGRFVLNDIGDGVISELFPIYRFKQDYVLKYWKYAIQVEKVMAQVYRKAITSSGASSNKLNEEDFLRESIRVPCLEEQQKIADFLSSVDEVIASSEEEVANLETQKKAAMKKFFSREVRFKKANGSDFPEWEEKLLGEIADVSKLAGFEFTKYVNYSESGNIVAIRGLNVKNGRLILDDVKYLDGSDFSKLDRSKLYIDDIMFTYVGTIGDAALVPENDKYYMAPNVCRIRMANQNPCFIMQQLLSDWFKKKIIKPLIATSSQPALSMENIRIFKMGIPCLEEQRLIADFLSDFDEAIAAAKKELELWKELEKGLLQQMFV